LPVPFPLRFRQIYAERHFIPRSAFEDSTCSFLLHATPLLEEKWDSGSQALIPNIRDPFLHDWSRAGTGLADNDHLIDFVTVSVLMGDLKDGLVNHHLQVHL